MNSYPAYAKLTQCQNLPERKKINMEVVKPTLINAEKGTARATESKTDSAANAAEMALESIINVEEIQSIRNLLDFLALDYLCIIVVDLVVLLN